MGLMIMQLNGLLHIYTIEVIRSIAIMNTQMLNM
jgi:hypothetical protein